MNASISSLRLRSVVGLAILAAASAGVACSGKSSGQSGAGGKAGASSGGSGGTTAGTGGATGGSSGRGSGGSSTGGVAGTSGGSAGQGGSGAGGSSGSGGSSGEGGEGGLDDRPVLERPVREEFTCAVTTPLDGRDADWVGGDVAATPDGTFVVWGRPANTGVEAAIMLATIDQTGTLGAPEPLATYPDALYSSRPRLASSTRGLSAAWLNVGQNEISTLYVAELDATGNVTAAPKAVAGIPERIAEPQLAPTAAGNALLFVEPAVDYSTMGPRFALLDAAGDLSGDVVELGPAQNQVQTGALAALPGGFAAAVTTWSGASFLTELLFLDESGAVQGEPIELNDARPYIGQSLLVRGDELIVAHADEEGSYEQSDIAGFITLSRFDVGTRERVAPDVRLQSPTVNEEVVNPVLFPVGDDVGLLWSRGSVIYICAGCTPDNHLEAVVLDGDDFTPLTDLLTLPNNQPMGGFVRPTVAPAGDHFVVVTDLRFHVSAAMATGAFQCTEVP